MPGRDLYYSNLAKNSQNGYAAGDMEAGKPTSVGLSSATDQTPGYTQAQAGGSPYEAGSGFVNLSHLLALNGASGQASANQAAQSLSKQGAKAQGAIQSAEDSYNKAVTGGTPAGTTGQGPAPTPDNQAGFLGRTDAARGFLDPQNRQSQIDQVKGALDKANAGYTGPMSMQDQSGYGQLSQQVSNAQNRAQNATNGAGQAAQIAQDTGLSPRQAAASAFYQGVTNQNLAKAGSKYTGLGAMLDAANARSVKSSDLARQVTAGNAGQLNDYYNQLSASPGNGMNPVKDLSWTTNDPPWASHQRGHSSELRDVDPEDEDDTYHTMARKLHNLPQNEGM